MFCCRVGISKGGASVFYLTALLPIWLAIADFPGKKEGQPKLPFC